MTLALKSSRTAVGSPDDETIALVLNNLGNVLYDQNNMKAALDAYEEGLTVERRIYPVYSQHISVTLMNIAGIYQARQDYKESMALYREALVINCALNGFCSEPVAGIKTIIATVYELQGIHDSAIDELNEVLQIRNKLHGGQHFLVSVTLNSLGLAQFQHGALSLALESFVKALDIRRLGEGETSRDITTVCYNAATVYKSIGEFDKAIALYNEIICIERGNLLITSASSSPSSSSDDHECLVREVRELERNASMREVTTILQQLALAHQENGNLVEAIKSMKEAAQICTEKPEIMGSQRHASDVFRLLGNLYVQIGDIGKAVETYAVATRLYKPQSHNLDALGVIGKHYFTLKMMGQLVTRAAAAA